MDEAVVVQITRPMREAGDTGDAEVLPGESCQRVVGQQVGGADDGFGVFKAGDAVAVGFEQALVIYLCYQQAGLALAGLEDDAFRHDMRARALSIGNQIGTGQLFELDRKSTRLNSSHT